MRVANSFDPDQARQYVGPDLGPKLFAKVIKDNTSRLDLFCCFTSKVNSYGHGGTSVHLTTLFPMQV